jgi:hypothetical protein
MARKSLAEIVDPPVSERPVPPARRRDDPRFRAVTTLVAISGVLVLSIVVGTVAVMAWFIVEMSKSKDEMVHRHAMAPTAVERAVAQASPYQWTSDFQFSVA